MLKLTPAVLMSIAAGGALGAIARYIIQHSFMVWFGTGFPWGTLIANVSGCLVIGFVISVWLNSNVMVSTELKAFLVIGFLGAFTTFSAFSLDTVLFLQNAEYLRALANIFSNLILCLIATGFGFWLSKLFVQAN